MLYLVFNTEVTALLVKLVHNMIGMEKVLLQTATTCLVAFGLIWSTKKRSLNGNTKVVSRIIQIELFQLMLVK